jgi:putative oxidoreductase
MNLRSILLPDPARTQPIALLLTRVATGLLLVPHGYFKITGGVAGLAGGLAAKGLPAPTALAWCAALAEFAGGIFLALGFLGRLSALAISITMVVAWVTMHLGNIKDIGGAGGSAFEYPFLLSVVALGLAISGPGRLSLDARLFGGRGAGAK